MVGKKLNGQLKRSGKNLSGSDGCMNEKQYFNEIYNKFWKEKTKEYGYGAYERNLVRTIVHLHPKNVFEVGIGTGWPIGAALRKKGIKVDGCDLAESSVLLAKEELGNEEGIWVGDVLSYNGENKYDVVYCVRVSWYIPNFYATLKKMISMTTLGGYVVFDIMDNFSLYCMRSNFFRIVDGYFRLWGIEKDEVFGQHFINPARMKSFLRRNGLKFQCRGERKITKDTNLLNTLKIVFLCKRQ